jgi:hypothetical protein
MNDDCPGLYYEHDLWLGHMMDHMQKSREMAGAVGQGPLLHRHALYIHWSVICSTT